MMDHNLKDYELCEDYVDMKTPVKVTKIGQGKSSNKCNQCEYASSHTRNLRNHLKTHSGEKQNKCNQCDYASSHSVHLRTHLKKHSGENPNKCNQCQYASPDVSNLRRHLKTHSGEKTNKCNQCDYASARADVSTDMIIVKSFTRPQFWGQEFYAENAKNSDISQFSTK